MDSDLLDYHHWMNKFLKAIVPTMQQQWILLLLCPFTRHPPTSVSADLPVAILWFTSTSGQSVFLWSASLCSRWSETCLLSLVTLPVASASGRFASLCSEASFLSALERAPVSSSGIISFNNNSMFVYNKMWHLKLVNILRYFTNRESYNRHKNKGVVFQRIIKLCTKFLSGLPYYNWWRNCRRYW